MEIDPHNDNAIEKADALREQMKSEREKRDESDAKQGIVIS